MNLIIKPITPDGQVGFDKFGQLCCWIVVPNSDGHTRGTIVSDVRGKKCQICGHGWEMNAESWWDQEWHNSWKELVHRSCHYRYIGLKEHDMWTGLFIEAGIRFEGLQKVKNPYYGEGPNAIPAFETTVYLRPAIKLHVGMRKRVWNMEMITEEHRFQPELYKSLPVGKTEDTKLFLNGSIDGISKVMVHAWTREQALQYLKDFRTLYEECCNELDSSTRA